MSYTIKTLIEELSKYDPNTPVLVDGYEGGLAYAEYIEERFVLDNGPDVPWYYGQCEVSDETNPKAFRAIVIPR